MSSWHKCNRKSQLNYEYFWESERDEEIKAGSESHRQLGRAGLELSSDHQSSAGFTSVRSFFPPISCVFLNKVLLGHSHPPLNRGCLFMSKAVFVLQWQRSSCHKSCTATNAKIYTNYPYAEVCWFLLQTSVSKPFFLLSFPQGAFWDFPP